MRTVRARQLTPVRAGADADAIAKMYSRCCMGEHASVLTPRKAALVRGLASLFHLPILLRRTELATEAGVHAIQTRGRDCVWRRLRLRLPTTTDFRGNVTPF
jgi:hypothetical protein